MTLIVHHLGLSQSERIVWLCEELALDYELKTYKRSPLLAPPELKKLHPEETAPIIQDGDITLAESGAIVEYILTNYGKGRLALGPSDPNYTDYLYWLHFANGTLQLAMSRNMFLRMAKLPADNPILAAAAGRREHAVKMLDARLKDNEWLAGKEFTAADIMTVVSLTTMRLFMPFSLEPYPNVLRYLERVGKRDGYKRAIEKGDPGLTPVMGAEAPKPLL
ncbi:hypothetical protein MMC28_001474 [Mycoblastus sanguinarius]|nr:hypothetical protein [Mycoblastus sanguinarius]